MSEPLFVAKGDEWVGLGRAAGGEEASGQACRNDDCDHGSECGRVCGGDARDLGGKEASEAIACDNAYENAGRYKTEAVEKHEAKNISLLSSQRHANANLVNSHRDGVGHHAEYADDD